MVLGVHVAAQTLLFLKSMLLGACLMLLYDLFRILRLAVKTPAAVILAEDLLFFALCALANMLFLISANFGEIRFFALLGEALGALLCALTLSRLVMACSKAVIGFVRAISGSSTGCCCGQPTGLCTGPPSKWCRPAIFLPIC